MERAAFQCLQIFAAPVMKFCLSFCFAYNNFAVTLIQNEVRHINFTKMTNFDNNAQTSTKSFRNDIPIF